MAKYNKPEIKDGNLEQLRQMDEITEYLLESCPPDATPHQKAQHVLKKLQDLTAVFKKSSKEGEVNVSTYGFIHRLEAKKNGYLDTASAPQIQKPDSRLSSEAMSIIDWLSDASSDELPSAGIQKEAEISFRDSLSSKKSTFKEALSEIFEITDGQVRLRKEALSKIQEKLVEKTAERIPEESREAIELALESDQPFSEISMTTAMLRDGGESFKRHPNGVIAPTADAMKHMLIRLLSDSSQGKQADNSGNNHK